METETISVGGNWKHYLTLAIGALVFIVLPVWLLLYFSDEIQQARAYGYAGVFVVGLLCGVSVIPSPIQALIFTFGHILNPIWVGIIAGFGAALGGLTVYLTGAGAQSVLTRFIKKEVDWEKKLGIPLEDPYSHRSKMWIWGKRQYEKFVGMKNSKSGVWALFIVSAMIISPFYAVGVAAGSMRIGIIKFFFVTLAGKTLKHITIAVAGYYGLELIRRIVW